MRDVLRKGEATELWRDLVSEGEARAATRLDEDIEAYLVFALMRHLGDASLVRRTMALELLEAMDAHGRRRLDELRDVGDRCLLIAGLFPKLAERRRVDRRYFADLGRGAYAHVADAARFAYADLFARLAETFDGMVQVLSHAAAVCQGEPLLARVRDDGTIAESSGRGAPVLIMQPGSDRLQ